jgi:hypothetical protein
MIAHRRTALKVGFTGRTPPADIGDLDEVALQILQVDAEVDPPVGAEAAGPADGRGIDGAGAVAVGQRRSRVALPKVVRALRGWIAHAKAPIFGGLKGRQEPSPG